MHEGYLHAWLTTRYPFCWQYIQSAKEHGKKKNKFFKKIQSQSNYTGNYTDKRNDFTIFVI